MVSQEYGYNHHSLLTYAHSATAQPMQQTKFPNQTLQPTARNSSMTSSL